MVAGSDIARRRLEIRHSWAEKSGELQTKEDKGVKAETKADERQDE